jgi:DNA adenine methylase
MSLQPIIKWSGGKRDEIKHFLKYIPTEYDTYIEPFVGGGAVYFHLNPRNAVISDVHPDLIALYSCIQKGMAPEIHDFMATHANDEDTYYSVRDEFKPETELEKACKFYYERKTCYRGMLRYNKKGGFNIPFGRYKRISYDELKDVRYIDLLKRTVVLNETFEEVFEKYNSEENFMFLDPPYDSTFTDYGYCKFTREHHVRLAECFKATKNKCMMVIGKTDFISELYTGYVVAEFDKKYAFKLHSGRVGNEINTKHLVILNYSVLDNTLSKNAE